MMRKRHAQEIRSVVKILFFFFLLDFAVAAINAQSAPPDRPERPVISFLDNGTLVIFSLVAPSGTSGPLQYSYRTQTRYKACLRQRWKTGWSEWSSWSENRVHALSTREPYTTLQVKVKARNSNNPEVEGPPGRRTTSIPLAEPVVRITDISCNLRNVTPSCTISVETDCRKYNGPGFKVYVDIIALANARQSRRNRRVYTRNLEYDGSVRFSIPPDLQPHKKFTLTAYPANNIGRNDDPNLSLSKVILSRSPSSGVVCHPVRCDGVEDCSDGSDEAVCPVLPGLVPRPKADAPSIDSSGDACGSGGVRCGDGQCVPVNSLCDGRLDCRDQSDEADCPTTQSMGPTIRPMGPTTPTTNSVCGPIVTTSEGTRPAEFQVDTSDPYFLWYWTTVHDTFINLSLVRWDNNNNHNNHNNNNGNNNKNRYNSASQPNLERLAPFIVRNPIELRRIKFSFTEKLEILGRDLPSQYNTEVTIQKVEVTSNYPVMWINCKTDDLLPLPQPTTSFVQGLVVTAVVMMVVTLVVQCLVIGLLWQHTKFTQTPDFQRLLAWDGKTQTPERTPTPTNEEGIYSYATATDLFQGGKVSDHNQEPGDPDHIYSNHELTNRTHHNQGGKVSDHTYQNQEPGDPDHIYSNHELTNRTNLNQAEDHTYEEVNLCVGNLRMGLRNVESPL